ncbi:hypothetical protein GCM10007036_10490 [Alsobacter metallidurans]|uniref:Uncharacterized protein n=1 Tax=Alsobacter metallidurans TaxID=340221 RepID=A0A917I5W7_9HYPH|nr:BA14K family protein [Alsobacter metallidurans]GGH12558.1 hypothetical protein GCM10007036_10490 [Alsobacter metallidurans]
MLARFLLTPAILAAMVVGGIQLLDAKTPKAAAPERKVASLEAIPSGGAAQSPVRSGPRDVLAQPTASRSPDQAAPATLSQPQVNATAIQTTAPAPTTVSVVPVSLPDKTTPARKPGAVAGAAGCTGYKSYSAATQTYRSFDGAVKPCREVPARSVALN